MALYPPLNPSETSLSSCDLLGFYSILRPFRPGKPRRTWISSPEAPQAELQQHEWAATYAWCETTCDPWAGVSLTYTWTMSPPLPAQETLNELPTYLGFSDRDSTGSRGTSHYWTRSIPGKWYLVDSGCGTPMPCLCSLQSHWEKRPQSFKRP